MELLERLAIERDCGRLPLLFARYADNGDHASLAQLFTEDCEFARPFQPDHPFFGRERVQAIFRDRPPILVRHIVTNVLVDVISPTEARGSNYLAMIAVLNRHNELKAHIRGALNNGLSMEEIREVLLQVGIYGGIPAAVDSFRLANEAFAEIDAEEES